MDVKLEDEALPCSKLVGRDAPPTHYLFKINSFSLLSKASIEEYSSDIFESGGHKWELSIYPTGNKSRNGQGHISIYLALADISSFPAGWEVNVIFNLFAFDQLRDKYFSLQDGMIRRFHAMKTEWGIGRFINLETFEDPSNGYLIDDTCVFGAEVFVVKSTCIEHCLSMLHNPVPYMHTWTIEGFAGLKTDRYACDAFICGDYKWKLVLYSNGNSHGEGNNVSLFLNMDTSNLPSDTKLFVSCTLRMMDQINGKHWEKTFHHLFSPPVVDWGYCNFMSLVRLNDSRNGFLLKDKCVIETEVTVLGTVTTGS